MNESSRELSFLGAKVPTGNFSSEERKYRGAKSPDTDRGDWREMIRVIVMLRAEYDYCTLFVPVHPR